MEGKQSQFQKIQLIGAKGPGKDNLEECGAGWEAPGGSLTLTWASVDNFLERVLIIY
jgi:hypothetical protein